MIDIDFWLSLRSDTIINKTNKNQNMKKLFTVLFIAGAMSIVACGPSAEEKAAKEKAKNDSIAAAQKAQATQDSIAAVAKAQEEAAAAALKAKEDSIAAAAAKKGSKGTKPAAGGAKTTKNAPKGKG